MSSTFAGRFDKAARLMDGAKEEVLAFSAFPRSHWRHLVDQLARALEQGAEGRCRVVGIFPTETALVRLASGVLLDVHKGWIAAERRYFSEGSMAKLHPERDDDDAIAGELETG